MPEPTCAGTSFWEYQDNSWVCVQDNCSGTCAGSQACKPALAREPDQVDPRIRAILDDPKEGDTIEGGCSCQ